ncbi:MAG: hypothetical protein LBD25_08935 [Coriobacteriales bacterium]|jgi:hypothetical protein|nr:hypothetical protein [Coriobacteriales bacterium]
MEELKENFNYKHAKSSWMSAAESLRLVAHLCDIGVVDGNLDSFMMEGSYHNYVVELGAPPAGTSYFAACVPMVFALLNSIELSIKGYEYAAYPQRAPRSPQRLSDLLDLFNAASYPKDPAVDALARKYTGDSAPELIVRFLAQSGMKVGDLLAMRRFINNNNFFNVVEPFEQFCYGTEEGKRFFEEVGKDVAPARAGISGLIAAIDDDGVPSGAVLALMLDPA